MTIASDRRFVIDEVLGIAKGWAAPRGGCGDRRRRRCRRVPLHRRAGPHAHGLSPCLARLHVAQRQAGDDGTRVVLERADLRLRLASNDFTAIVPALAGEVLRDVGARVEIGTQVAANATNVLCDTHLVEAAIKNLLYNATRYARREIRVSVEIAGGANRLRVDDDGPGIAPGDRLRVFESFVQLEQPSGRKKGFGLGLAIVRRAMEWHGGTVLVSDSPLGGARFEATWPARPREP